MASEINNHIELALERLIEQYKGKTRIEGFLRAIVKPVQGIEDVFQDLSTQRWLDTATGDLLDRIGNIVGIARNFGESDASYRLRIDTRIIINVSNGEPESAIAVFQRYLESDLVLYQEAYPGGIIMMSDVSVSDQDTINQIYEEIEDVIPAGVRVDALGEFDPDEAFSMDGLLPGFGFGDATDASEGGKFGEIWLYTGVEFAFGSTLSDGVDTTGGGFGTLEDARIGGVFVSA